MFEDLDPHGPIAPPSDAIGLAMRRGRTIRRQRHTAVAAGIALSTALIGGFAFSNPLTMNNAQQTPIAPVTVATATLPAGVGADRLDTGTITKVNSTATGTITIVYNRYNCNAELDARRLAETGMASCLGSESSEFADSFGTDAHTSRRAELASTVTVAGSSQLAEFLNKADPPSGNWVQQPAKNRQIPLTDLRRFLATPESSNTVFRLHFGTDARIDQIEEIYQS
jgi:hypothetical protein